MGFEYTISQSRHLMRLPDTRFWFFYTERQFQLHDLGLLARMFLVVLFLGTASVFPASPPSTYPPAPGQVLAPSGAESDARKSLFEGKAEEALRLLLAAQPERGGDPAHARLAGLTFLALERPARAIESLARGGEEEREMAAFLLRRQAPDAAPAAFKPTQAPWPGITREILKEKDPRALLSSPDGTLWLMSKDRLAHLSPEGRTLATMSLPGARDLVSDGEGGPIALGSKQVLWRGKVLLLPPDLDKPISAAESPDGRLFLLDGRGPALVQLSSSGKVEGRSVFPLGDPVRVRVDGVGRVYLLDATTRCVFVYSAALSPLRILDPEARGLKLRKASDLFVDFAGDMLLLDGREDAAALFSAQGRFLGASRREETRMEALSWDGTGSLVYLDRHEDSVGRVDL